MPNISDDTHDAYRAMVTCVGAVVRKGNGAEKATLLAALRELSNTGVSSGHQKNSSSTPNIIPDDWTGERLRKSASDRSLSGNPLGRYSVALREHCDQHDFVPEYTVQAVSIYPPKYKAIVTFNDFSFEGTARNKKQARHQAAREACNFLKI